MMTFTKRTALLVITMIPSLISNYSIAAETGNLQLIQTQLPGTERFKPALLNKIHKLRIQRGNSYKARTTHIKKNGEATYTNRLFLESSPYLLQHAHNPVNWYPWSEDAFIAAVKLNRPVLLSIGYSTCHWCHVMESESFEDIKIAKYINENFIAIKVDREERPDIDAIYMAALQAMGQGTGWPLNIWLTPDKEPFYGGTYFPARDGDRGVSTGLLTLLKKLNRAYQQQPDEIHKISQELVDVISPNYSADTDRSLPTNDIFKHAMDYYENKFDSFNGGIGDAPKFPARTPIQFLLRYYRNTADKTALEIVELTLDKMAAGGIYDQIGGGFHRYSIDNEWLVPHFEKMLYDNALLVIDYLEAYQTTKNPDYKKIVNETLQYISRDMTSPQGSFYTATDADSKNDSGEYKEGYYFTWDDDEFSKIIGSKRDTIMKEYYGVTGMGNFDGRNILSTPFNHHEFVNTFNIRRPALEKNIEQSKKLLLKYRDKRNKPLRDEKIITAWNGLMISAYAKAGFILKNNDYINRATDSANFIIDNLIINDKLHRRFHENSAGLNGYLNDYAFFIASLIDLYESTFDIIWLKQAIKLDNVLEKQFEDKINGGFYLTSNDHEKLLYREKPAYDGSIPGGNSVHISNLLRLGLFTSQEMYYERATSALRAFSRELIKSPKDFSKMLNAVDFYNDEAKEIIIIKPENKSSESNIFLDELRNTFHPNHILSVITEGNDLKNQSSTISIADGKTAINGKTTVYVCKLGSCELPTTDIKIFSQQLKNK